MGCTIGNPLYSNSQRTTARLLMTSFDRGGITSTMSFIFVKRDI